MGSEEWRRKQKKQKPSGTLADWADSNGVPKRVAGLIADGEATARVVEILKKYRARGATLSSAQRTSLVAELNGAGQWSGTAGRKASPPEPSRSSRADGTARPRSYAAVAAGTAADVAVLRAEIAALKVAAAAGPAETRPPRRAWRIARRVNSAAATDAVTPAPSSTAPGRRAKRVALAETEPSEIAVEAEEEELCEEAGWICTSCMATHRSLTRKCRICLLPRAPAAAPAASTTALSGEEAAKKRTDLQTCIAYMLTCGAKPDAIAAMQASLALLDKPVAAPPLPDLLEQHAAATAADVDAANYEKALRNRGCELMAKMEEAQADVAAHAIAYGKAQQRCRDAAIQMAAVQRAVGAQGTTTGPAVARAAPAVPAQAAVLETVRCTVDASFAQEVETLNSPGAEEDIQLEMKAYEERWGCTRANFPMARYLAERTAAMRKVVTGVAPVKPEDGSLPAEPIPTMAATATNVAKAPPARPTAAPTAGGAGGESLLPKRGSPKEGTRLPDRNSIKTESLNETSRTQVAKESCSKAQRDEERDAMLARHRREFEDLTTEAEADRLDVGATP